MEKYLLFLLMFTCRNIIIAQIPVTGLQNWYKADVGFNGTNFPVWTDQSGKNNTMDLGFSTPVTPPVLQTDANGKKYIRFPKVADEPIRVFPYILSGITEISTHNPSTWSSTSTGLSLFMVHNSSNYLTPAAEGGLRLTSSRTFSLAASAGTSGLISFTGCNRNLFAASSGIQLLCATFVPASATGQNVYVNGDLVSTISTVGCTYTPGNNSVV